MGKGDGLREGKGDGLRVGKGDGLRVEKGEGWWDKFGLRVGRG